MKSIVKKDFYFDLPEERIAKFPLSKRDESKLLVFQNGEIQQDSFKQIAEYIDSNTLLVMNNAKVIPARLYFNRDSGALIEVLLLEPILPGNYEEIFNATGRVQWKCIIGNSKKWKDGELIHLTNHPELLTAKLISRDQRIVELTWSCAENFSDLLDKIGELPLPPYLNRSTEDADYQTYQTVFAKKAGSVAAPTAGLHFTDEVFDLLYEKNIQTAEVTLHVGAGTFLPVKAENVLDHEMHLEYFEIELGALEQLLASEKRVAVGTTTLRVLESLYWIGIQIGNNNTNFHVQKLEPYEVEAHLSYDDALQLIAEYMVYNGLTRLQASTEILILPHYTPRSINALITNFHLPESTLLMLIASIVCDEWKQIYKYALENDFRFLSYGDSSLLFVE
jgi:S-adenosylmethionine:tRNA ribosyltransferase-isomerase